MLSPNLVESQVKHILHYNLVSCHDMKMKTFSFLFNMICFFLIVSIIGTILYYKYKGQQDQQTKKLKEDQKRDYILYNLRKFQNIKNKHMTNISLI